MVVGGIPAPRPWQQAAKGEGEEEEGAPSTPQTVPQVPPPQVTPHHPIATEAVSIPVTRGHGKELLHPPQQQHEAPARQLPQLRMPEPSITPSPQPHGLTPPWQYETQYNEHGRAVSPVMARVLAAREAFRGHRAPKQPTAGTAQRGAEPEQRGAYQAPVQEPGPQAGWEGGESAEMGRREPVLLVPAASPASAQGQEEAGAESMLVHFERPARVRGLGPQGAGVQPLAVAGDVLCTRHFANRCEYRLPPMHGSPPCPSHTHYTAHLHTTPLNHPPKQEEAGGIREPLLTAEQGEGGHPAPLGHPPSGNFWSSAAHIANAVLGVGRCCPIFCLHMLIHSSSLLSSGYIVHCLWCIHMHPCLAGKCVCSPLPLAGVVAIPRAFALLGLVGGSVALALLGLLSFASKSILIRAAHVTGMAHL
jgi:hypothetical protein